MSDAEKVLRGHLDDPITIAALSQTVGVSERTLRNAFADVHRESPKRYFLNQRLQRVRQTLSGAANKAATVTAVATDHGFYELGRLPCNTARASANPRRRRYAAIGCRRRCRARSDEAGITTQVV